MEIEIHNNGFGEINTAIIGALLVEIASTFENISGKSIDKKVYIIYRDNGPMCSDFQYGRVISLSASGQYWCQWIYQFAHEYCHHLIDGEMSGQLKGVRWFEECLCHTASLFFLSIFSNPMIWHQWGYPHFALSVRKYLDAQLAYSLALRNDFYEHYQNHDPAGIRIWLPSLTNEDESENPQYPRDLYNAVASIMLPTFLRNNQLWGILQHIGQSKDWQSLEELLAHLEVTASPAYLEAVREMKMVLLP